MIPDWGTGLTGLRGAGGIVSWGAALNQAREESFIQAGPGRSIALTTPRAAGAADQGRRDRLSRPCFGANTMASRNSSVCTTTMQPAVEASMK